VGDSSAVASAYAATIDWGDGTSTSAGTVSGTGGVFAVQGSHIYTVDSYDATSHTYQATVTLTKGGQTVLTATHAVEVVRPMLTLQMANVVVQPNGTVNSQTIATLEVPNGSDFTSEFAATITWGDGTTSSGTVSGSNGLFQVAGGHTYATPGNYTIQLEVSQAWGSSWATNRALSAARLPVAFAPAPLLPRVKGPIIAVASATAAPVVAWANLTTVVVSSRNSPVISGSTITPGGWVQALALSSDGKYLAVAVHDAGGMDSLVKVYQLSGASPDFTLKYTIRVVQDRVVPNAFAFSQGGRLLALGTSFGHVYVYNTATGKQLMTRRVGPQVEALAFSPDSTTVAVASSDPTRPNAGSRVRLLNAATGNVLYDSGVLADFLVHSLAFSRNGKRLLMAGGGMIALRLFDVENRKALWSVQTPDREPVTATFDATGTRIVAGDNGGNVRVFNGSDANGNQILKRAVTSGNGIVRVVVSSDNKTILAAGEKGLVPTLTSKFILLLAEMEQIPE
jgi:WD40 repeat protein